MTITSAIAIALVLFMILWGLYVSKHAHEYPEWFEEDMSWGEWEKLKKEKEADNE